MRGLNMLCNGDEGQIFSTVVSDAFNGFFAAEISFYKEFTAYNMQYGSVSEAISSDQGRVCRVWRFGR